MFTIMQASALFIYRRTGQCIINRHASQCDIYRRTGQYITHRSVHHTHRPVHHTHRPVHHTQASASFTKGTRRDQFNTPTLRHRITRVS